MRRRTSASISRLETDTSNAGSLHGGRRRTQSGLSHSCERPTSISPAPRAQTISVALANSETMRTLVIVVGLARVVHKRRRKEGFGTERVQVFPAEVSLPPLVEGRQCWYGFADRFL